MRATPMRSLISAQAAKRWLWTALLACQEGFASVRRVLVSVADTII